MIVSDKNSCAFGESVYTIERPHPNQNHFELKSGVQFVGRSYGGPKRNLRHGFYGSNQDPVRPSGESTLSP